MSKTIWLTGASSGIGEALARRLARDGARLALTSRRGDELARVVSEITAVGGNAVAFPCDVTQRDEVITVGGRIINHFGKLDIVIANAGTHRFTVPEQFDSKEYLDLMNLNYGGMLHTINAVLPDMIARRAGHVVGVASLAGTRGLPRAAAYGASKAAMHHFLESIRFHLVRHDVDVTIVNPGFVKTPLTDKNDFYMPFLVSAEQSADIIARGIARRAREVSFPFPFNWLVKSGKFLPAPLYEAIVNRLW